MMNHDDIKNEISMHFQNLFNYGRLMNFKYLEKSYSKCIHSIYKSVNTTKNLY